MFRPYMFLWMMAVFIVGLGWQGSAAAVDMVKPVIVSPADASWMEQLAAREVRRYLYVRTGIFLSISDTLPDRANAVVVARSDRPFARAMGPVEKGGQKYAITTHEGSGRRLVYIVGGGDLGTLYGAYRFAELLDVRFYLHGDVVPDERMGLVLPKVNVQEAPLFSLRGIQPFHDFPEGPDWWNTDDYMAIIAQLPKMRMNFFGLHTYPENRPNAEPTVWIGLPEDAMDSGAVKSAYPASYYNTSLPVSWGFLPKKTSDYHFGAGMLFDRDGYGSEIMRDLEPRPETPTKMVEVFNRTGAMFKTSFGLARNLGVKTCIGTETPLVVPQKVTEKPNISELLLFKPLGGKTASCNRDIAGTEDDPLYQTCRFDLRGYDVTVPEGVYTVTLRFCEITYDAPGGRIFDVKLEGKKVLTDLDIFATVGKDKALEYTFEKIIVTDNQIDIDFYPKTEFPLISAFEIVGDNYDLQVNCGGGVYKGYEGDAFGLPLDRDVMQQLYEGVFTRIAKTHPLDYYWFWTPENWTWEDVPESTVHTAIEDILTAVTAAGAAKAPFQLATCGWVLGPQFDRTLFDARLPKNLPISCISRAVGHDPVEPGFAKVSGRDKWAIPWLEDDPAMTSPQLWAGRMRRDAYDARQYGC
ncbi:MAG: hypothetical protein QG656_86, partial [Candidatus Hydrogenedentes bacterium]|nr:hypothetical protein [Candidatus Hydrogenedentota bacterium]